MTDWPLLGKGQMAATAIRSRAIVDTEPSDARRASSSRNAMVMGMAAFIPSIEKGIREAMEASCGVLAQGWLPGGRRQGPPSLRYFHEVDSSGP
jgi:hypothetical protein